MESETPSPGCVKRDAQKKGLGKSPMAEGETAATDGSEAVLDPIHGWLKRTAPPPLRGARDNWGRPAAGEVTHGEFSGVSLEFQNMVRRFDGYCRHCFTDGMPWLMLSRLKQQFAKARGLSAKHIDEVARIWMQHTARWKFTRTRCYQSPTSRRTCPCIVIEPVQVSTVKQSTWMTRHRLLGAIKSFLRGRSVAHVDKQFVANFVALHGLDPIAAWYAWHTLKHVPGYRASWEGYGEGRKFVVKRTNAVSQAVSPPGKAAGISPPTSGKNRSNNGPAAGFSGRSSGSLRSRPGEAVEMRPPLRNRLCAPLFFRPRAVDPPERGAEKTAGEGPKKPPGNATRAMRGPLQMCERLIPEKKLGAKANFLAFAVLKNFHALHWRVAFGKPHARKFALMALRAGHVDTAIVAAYRAGLEVAGASAERDWREAGLEKEWRPRCPSQVVSVAWRELRRDGRTAEERWLAFFRGEVAPAKIFSLEVPSAAEAAKVIEWEPKWSSQTSTDGDPIAERRAWKKKRAAAAAPNPTPAILRAASAAHFDGGEKAANFEAALKAKRLTLAELMKLPRAAQQKFVREMLGGKDSQSEA